MSSNNTQNYFRRPTKDICAFLRLYKKTNSYETDNLFAAAAFTEFLWTGKIKISIPGAATPAHEYVTSHELAIQTNEIIKVCGLQAILPYERYEICPNIFMSAQLETLAITDIRDVPTLLPGAYQQRRGDAINLFGSRTDGILYVVDGMRIPQW